MVYSTSKKLFIDLIIRGVLILIVLVSAFLLLMKIKDQNEQVAIHQQRMKVLVDLQNTWVSINNTPIAVNNSIDSINPEQISFISSQIAEKKIILANEPKNDTSFTNGLAVITKDIDLLDASISNKQGKLPAMRNTIAKLSDHALTSLSVMLANENDLLNYSLISGTEIVNIFIYVVMGAAFWLFLLNAFVYFTSLRKLKEHENRITEVVIKQQETEISENAKTEYMAMISHEIRTPMNGVLGMSNLLLNSSLTAEQKEYATSIHHSTEKLLRTVNDVLDYSLLEADKIVLDNNNFDIRKLVADVLSMHPVGSKDVKVLADVNAAVPQVLWADSLRLQQVLSVFLSNAVKFTESGSIQIQCSPIATLDDQVIKLGFHIVDTGIGISEDRIERLFEPFLAAGNTSARKYTGNGMGLFIARRLINLMGGKVKVDSKPGQGTTFSFYILVRSGVAEGANTKNITPRPIPTPVENTASIKGADAMPTITNYVAETVIPDTTDVPSITTAPIEDTSFTRAVNEAINPGDEVTEIVKIPEVENVIPELLNTGFSTPNTAVEEFSDTTVDTAIPEANSIINTTVEPIVEHAKIPTITKIIGEEEIVENAPPVLNILAVDDNEINLMLISKSLQKIGYECKKATNGEQAVEMVKKEKFDLIFMDMQMPIMDGTDATTEIRKHYRIFEYPVVIALTANAIGDGREKCLEAGMQDFITKPFKPAQIEEIIREWAPKIEVYREKFSDIAP